MRRLAAVAALLLVTGCHGVGKLDWTSFGRDVWQRPGDVVQALELAPGDRVADLGAGEGYFVPHLSEAVGAEGRVYAVDVEADIVRSLEERFPPDRTNVEVVLGDFGDPGLGDGSVDLVLIVNTYHHIEDRPAYFRRLKADLRPGARVAVIEPNQDLGGLLSLTLDDGHTSSAPAVAEEMARAGYALDTTHDFLAVQIFQVYAPTGDGG
ncbi:MAG: methyltransferase domain-containing protein [Myxococcota bacterium]|nr:methyltransferase domain-containing protein [Myxococcota bacterium]